MDDTNPYAPTTDTNADTAATDVPHLDPPQTVRYHMSAQVLTAFWTHRSLTSTSEMNLRRRIVRRAILITGIMLLALLALAYISMLDVLVASILAVLLVLLAAVIVNAHRPASIRLAYAHAANRWLDDSPNEHLLSERTVTVEAGGLRQTTPASESFTCWDAFERIDHDDDYLYLFDSSFTAVVVPRTAFATQGQFLGFVQLAKRMADSAVLP